MEDFVVNVRQIGNYPEATTTAASDLLLLQQGGLGGVYASITPSDLVASTLLATNPVKLAPTAAIQWNGASLSFGPTDFMFNKDITVPALHATNISLNGDPVATQPFVTAAVDALIFVSSFNMRTGDVLLETDDVLRAGGAPIWNPHFGGHVTVPTAWNPDANDDTAASTAFVQAAICQQLMSGHVVLSYNGRGGNVVPIADDVSTALTVPGVYGLANTPPIGDTSKRIANTSFVDQSLAFFQTEMEDSFADMAAKLDAAYAPLDSPQFTGIPTAPTAAQTVSSGQLATTAFVKAAVTAATTGVASFNTRTGAVVLTGGDVTGAGGALLASPAFTGTPSAPTAAPGDNTTKIATTAFVNAAITGFNAGVTSFNTRVGAVVLTSADVTAVGGAPIASPTFSGIPAGPTAAPATNTTQLATTAFVTQAITALPTSVASFNGRTGAITFQASDISAVNGALLASPVFTGTPTAPTAIAGNSTTQLATTAFVAAAVAGVAAGVSSYNGRSGAVTSQASDITSVGGALLASPTFTGLPAGPTATAGTNTTQLATTAFVQAALGAAAGVASFNGRTGAVTFQASDVSAVGGALLASPALSGNPTAPTPSPGDNDTSIATTAFVTTALAGAGGVSSFNSRAGAVVLTAADVASTAMAVRYDVAQSLTSPQQIQARANIGATPIAIARMQTIAATGTYTPDPNMVFCLVECQGAGGGGGCGQSVSGWVTGGGGGGSGAYTRTWFTKAQIAGSQLITIGAGGASGNPGNGGNGGNTIFGAGSLVVAGGGFGGGASSGGSGGAGGTGATTGSGGQLQLAGKHGFCGGGAPSTQGTFGGHGADAMFGQGAVGPFGNTATNATSGVLGGGGAGGIAYNAVAGAGGAGGAGVVYVTEYCSA